MSIERAMELHKQIVAKEAKKADLLGKLGKSLELGKLWPGLWETRKESGGVVTAGWSRQHTALTFRITLWGPDRKDVIERRRFTRPEVPASLDNLVATEEARSKLVSPAMRKRFDARQF